MGFQQDSAKRGVISWIMAVLSCLLFTSVGWNMYLVKEKSEMETIHRQEMNAVHDKYFEKFQQILDKALKIEKTVDTIRKA